MFCEELKFKKLSEVSSSIDFDVSSNFQFPGPHCPLFGVVLVTSYLKNSIVIVIGTKECTIYTKTFTMHRQLHDRSAVDNVFSFCLNSQNVIFGAFDELTNAILEIDSKYRPEAIFLVSTCVPEITGEDLERVIRSVECKTQSKIVAIQTDHLGSYDHHSGIQKTYESLVNIMKKTSEISKSVNILGFRYNGIEKTELYRLLKEKDIIINQTVPASTNINKIIKAPEAKLNIVLDYSAVGMAKKMQELFNIDYVVFDRSLNIDDIEKNYLVLSDKLEIDLSKEIRELKFEASKIIDASVDTLNGKTFVYSNAPYNTLEFSSFLTHLGMKPLLISIRHISNEELRFREFILNSGVDPYISQTANIALVRKLYDYIRPDIYIGHEDQNYLFSKGIKMVVLDSLASKVGFELVTETINSISYSLSDNIHLKNLKHRRSENGASF